MLRELLFALLGFVGDIIVEKDSTFCVKDGFDLLREGERDQVNRLVPLGWYYVNLGKKVAQNDLSWSSSAKSKVYMISMVQGVSDLLQEYVGDVSYLEQLILADGPIPLSQVLQHLQKYLLVFPPLYAMLEEIEKNRLHGCRILDYFYSYNTGIPVLQEVINRIVLRLRIVFLKQCFAWMIHGELDDPGLEFFVQAKVSTLASGTSSAPEKESSSDEALLAQVMRKLYQAKAVTQDMFGGVSTSHTQESKNFDWTSSFTLSLDKIPGSHVSPRIAGKILFAGKAVKLLQSSGLLAATSTSSEKGREPRVNAENLGYSTSEAYKYLSSGNSFESSDSAAEEKSIDNNNTFTPPQQTSQASKDSQGSDQQVREAYQEYVESGGYSVEDSVLFTEQFSNILRHPDQAVEMLEAAVEGINDTISNRLWVLLRDSYGFRPFLQVIRSTYLLGRGELFQSLLDGVLALTLAPTPAGLEMDNILNWKVLRTSAKLVGLENDDSLNDLIKLRVNNADMAVRDFALHKPDLQLVGAAAELPVLGLQFDAAHASTTPARTSEDVRVGQRTLVELCRPATSTSYEQFQHTWSHFLRKKIVNGDQNNTATRDFSSPASVKTSVFEGGVDRVGDDDDISDLDEEDSLDGDHTHRNRRAPGSSHDNSVPQKGPTLKYCPGAICIVDQKFVSRGFNLSASFACSWNDLRAQLTSQHAFFKATELSLRSDSADHSAEQTIFPPLGSGATAVLLGSVACGLHGDRKSGTQTFTGAAGSLSIGVKFYALTVSGTSGVRYFARLFLRTGTQRDNGSASSRMFQQHHAGQGSVGTGAMDYAAASANISNDAFLGEGVIDIDNNLEGLGFDQYITKSISSTSPFKLEIEYARSLQKDPHSPQPRSSAYSDAASVRSLASDRFNSNNSIYGESGSSVVYTLRARLDDSLRGGPSAFASPVAAAWRGLASSAKQSAPVAWDMEIPLDVPSHVKCQGGQAFVSLEGSGLIIPQRNHAATSSVDVSNAFTMQVSSLDFAGKGALSTYPVASASTFTRYPDTFARIQNEVDRVRAWMHMKLQLAFPPMFRVIFDAEAVMCYERIFSAIMKVRVVAHALERLWIARSRLAADRTFCQSRHSMHFFVSNLLYYLQVDVVDSEYSVLQRDISAAADFQSVLRAHKTFTSNMLRLSLIDNTSVQEGIERILQICLRFIAVCRIQHQSEYLDEPEAGAHSAHSTPASRARGEVPMQQLPPIYVPPEELGHIRKDFFAQVTQLFQLMRKVESRGFIFRLDFNSFLSNCSLDST